MRAVSIERGDNDVLIVVLRGELDFTQASEIAENVRDAVLDHRPRAVTVDLADVSFLDSSGIGVLVHTMKSAAEVNASFTVENATDMVFDQLEMAGLVPVFGMGPGSAQA